MGRKRVRRVLVALAATVSLISIPVASYAATATGNTVITANIASVITISTLSNVAISITPTAAGSATNASDTVTVSTNNSAGYTLNLKDSDAVLTLTKGSDTIANHTGTMASPTALPANTWGWRVDGAGGFGAGPTSVQSNVAALTGNYAGIQNNASAGDNIKVTSTTATNDTTTVWYGVEVTSAKPNGAYTNTVVYTATTN